jgi:HAD superfamily phosphatase (TIGR01668 family)
MAKNRGLYADYQVKNIQEIPLEQLWQQGIRGLLLDVDNTLTAWRSMQVEQAVCYWLQQVAAAGFRVCILSNSDPDRVRPIGELLQVPVVYRARKPRRGGFLRACQQLGLPPEQVAMVGDQLFTDIWGANRAGLTSILTEIVDPREFWGTRYVARRMEKLVKRKMNNE